MFGGVALRNIQVRPGGPSEHMSREFLTRARTAGVRFCNISPMRDDAAAFLEAEWIAPRPNTDTAIMLALAHTLLSEELYDADFVRSHCVGF
jgi:biotin/methionine sulfoxide reductase